MKLIRGQGSSGRRDHRAKSPFRVCSATKPPGPLGGFFIAAPWACEFVRSKSLLNHADSRFLRLWICCGLAVDNLVRSGRAESPAGYARRFFL